MTDYSYLFDSEKIYSQNILGFYNLFNNENVIECLNPRILENKFFLYLVYPDEKIVKELLLNDELIRFRFIDFFSENVSLIEERQRKIKEFLLTNDIDYLDSVLKYVNTNIDIGKMNSLKYIIEDITSNKELYLQYILSQCFEFRNYIFISIENLSKRLIILYYFNFFFIKNRNTNLNIKDSDYIEFTRLLIKNREIYNINEDFTSIQFKKDTDFIHIEDEKKYLLLQFFHSLTNPILITKNVIAWFYIFFSEYIPKELQNDILYIILGFKKNTLGFIIEILKSYNKDFYKFTEEEKTNVTESITNDYIFKKNENIANKPDIKKYINNLILLDNIKKEIEFNFLSNIKYSDIKKERFFFILSYNPLKESWSSISNQIKRTESKFENMNITIDLLIKMYNSINFTDFSKKEINIILNTGQYKRISFEVLMNNINNINELDIFDKDILFFNFLLFLNNFEIVIFNKETILVNIIEKYNTDINKIKNIFLGIRPFKDFYNGYKGFK